MSFPLDNITTELPAPLEATFKTDRIQAISESPFSGKIQVYEYPSSKILLSVDYPPMKETDGRKMAAWVESMQGFNGTMYYRDPTGNIKGAHTAGNLTITVKTSVNQMTASGFTPSQTGALLKGDWIQFSNYEYKRLIADVDADVSGLGVLKFEPFLRDSTIGVGGTIVADETGKGIFRFASIPNVSVQLARLYNTSLQFAEDIS